MVVSPMRRGPAFVVLYVVDVHVAPLGAAERTGMLRLFRFGLRTEIKKILHMFIKCQSKK